MESAGRRVVALVRRVHALRGEVRVEVLTDDPSTRFARGSRLFREGSAEPLTVVASRPVADGPGWRVRFRELPDRTAVESLRDTYLEAEVADRPDRSDAEEPVWWDEVVGASVVGRDGEPLGTVRDVYRAGEAEVYSVDGGGRGPFELPAVRDWIVEFAPRDGRIVVDADALDLPPPGRSRRPRGRRTTNRARATTARTEAP